MWEKKRRFLFCCPISSGNRTAAYLLFFLIFKTKTKMCPGIIVISSSYYLTPTTSLTWPRNSITVQALIWNHFTILALTTVCSLQSSSEPLWWFIGKLNRHLKKSDGELFVNVSCHPQSKAFMNSLCLYYSVHQLIQKVKSKVAVLQKCPTSLV